MTFTSTSCSTLETTNYFIYSSASLQPSAVWGNFICGKKVTGGGVMQAGEAGVAVEGGKMMEWQQE